MNNFSELLELVKKCDTKKVAVAVAQDDAVLEAVKAAKDANIADAILVGDADKIKEVAASISMDLTGFEIIDVKDTTEAALTAVKLVHDGKADIDTTLCVGCGVCTQMCKFDAILGGESHD